MYFIITLFIVLIEFFNKINLSRKFTVNWCVFFFVAIYNPEKMVNRGFVDLLILLKSVFY